MGIEIRPAEASRQAANDTQALRQLREDAIDRRSACIAFSQEVVLQGKAWDSIKRHFGEAWAAWWLAVANAAEELEGMNDRLENAASSYWGGAGRVSEQQLIEQQNSIRSTIYELEGHLGARLSPRYLDSLRDLDEYTGNRLSKVYDYCAETNGLYSSAALDIVRTGLSYLTTAQFNPESGFSYQQSAAWMANAERAFYGTTKAAFVKLQKERFGFDDETAESLWTVYSGLRNQLPNATQQQLDWLYLRLIGGLSYSGSQWDIVAGEALIIIQKIANPESDVVYGVKEEVVFSFLGLSAAEYRRLRYNVRLQNQMTGGKKDELDWKNDPSKRDAFFASYKEAYGENASLEEFERFWNARLDVWAGGGRADFAHHCITLATGLVTSLDFHSSFIDLCFSGGSGEREDASGWLGDATIIQKRDDHRGYEHTSLGNDDYLADLDADNILHFMKDGSLGYQEAAERYFSGIEAGEWTRAELFLQNNGGYEAVVDKVFENVQNPDLAVNIQTGWKKGPNVPSGSGLSTADKVAYLESEPCFEDTAAFLKALKENRHEL
ncbi:hypothetical protein B5F40_14875 [Gordonibacter sp. An230]|uniref:hypothetical protein n=1 Tax=Gordonibacter sp. An230 TaxID=1965592 RepID=UPI000B57B92E|nr:hypothetical protein [Gordonibacter sp. An230]OUO86551.1 hypothetical protein B5F40_14875 [Gordonibacter sp. An230]